MLSLFLKVVSKGLSFLLMVESWFVCLVLTLFGLRVFEKVGRSVVSMDIGWLGWLQRWVLILVGGRVALSV